MVRNYTVMAMESLHGKLRKILVDDRKEEKQEFCEALQRKKNLGRRKRGNFWEGG